MTTSVVVQNGATTRQGGRVHVKYTANGTDDSANSAAITVGELSAVTDVWGVQVVNASGVHRMPQGVVSVSGNVVTVADSGLAVGEIIKFTAIGVS